VPKLNHDSLQDATTILEIYKKVEHDWEDTIHLDNPHDQGPQPPKEINSQKASTWINNQNFQHIPFQGYRHPPPGQPICHSNYEKNIQSIPNIRDNFQRENQCSESSNSIKGTNNNLSQDSNQNTIRNLPLPITTDNQSRQVQSNNSNTLKQTNLDTFYDSQVVNFNDSNIQDNKLIIGSQNIKLRDRVSAFSEISPLRPSSVDLMELEENSSLIDVFLCEPPSPATSSIENNKELKKQSQLFPDLTEEEINELLAPSNSEDRNNIFGDILDLSVTPDRILDDDFNIDNFMIFPVNEMQNNTQSVKQNSKAEILEPTTSIPVVNPTDTEMENYVTDHSQTFRSFSPESSIIIEFVKEKQINT